MAAKKKAATLEALAKREGYELEREKGGSIVLRPVGGATAVRYQNESEAREALSS